MIEIYDSPERAVAFQREIEREFRRRRLRVQCIEQSYSIGKPADLYQVVSGEP